MSLIATLLSGDKPTFEGFAQIFNVDEYRDKLKPEPEQDLEMSDEEFRRLKAAAKKSNPDYFRNKTEKADARYLDALRHCNLTVKEIAEKTGREKSQVQRQVRVLEAKGMIRQVDTVSNGANPAIVWGLK